MRLLDVKSAQKSSTYLLIVILALEAHRLAYQDIYVRLLK